MEELGQPGRLEFLWPLIQMGLKKTKHDAISPGGPKADSGGKEAGGQEAVLAPQDSVLTPVSGYKEVWRNRIGSTQRPFSEPTGTYFSLGELGLIDMM